MRGKNVLVEWLQRGVVAGSERVRGDQDMMMPGIARRFNKCGYVKILGKPESHVLVIEEESDGFDNAR